MMSNHLPQRPHTAIGNLALNHADHTHPFRGRKSYKHFKDAYSPVKYPRPFENVETFNLSPGYRLSRSAGKVYVKINPNMFFDNPKPEPPPKKPNYKEMESLLKDLQEQVSTLSLYLEEERLRHGGTKKRANVDLQNLEKNLQEKHVFEINQLLQKHDDEKADITEQHQKNVKEIEAENQKRYDSLTNEYRLLKASFKNYRTTLQEEMHGQWKIKLDELEWEKRHAIDNAVDDSKRVMEDKFSIERQEMRKEFRANMNEIMRDHRQELEMVTKKLTGGDLNIEELKKRSFLLDEAQQELKELKSKLEEEQLLVRKTKMELNDVRMKLSSLESQFEERVASVEDRHRSKIESLTMERADARLLIARSCESLQNEKIAREIAEAERKEAAVRSLEARIKESENKPKSPEEKPTKVDVAPTDSAHPLPVEKRDDRTEEREIEVESKPSDRESDISMVLDAVCEANLEAVEVVKVDAENATPTRSKPKRVSTAPTKIRHPLRFAVPPIDKKSTVATITLGSLPSPNPRAPDQAHKEQLDKNKKDDPPDSPSVIH